MKTYSYIDLFSGAGGLSEGFIRGGYFPVAHIEMDKDACNTLRTRTAYHYLKNKKIFKSYISYLKGEITRDELFKKIPASLLATVLNEKITEKTIKGIFEKIKTNLKTFKKQNVDIVIGGPPCQAYSNIGRSVDENGMKDDERNYLYKMYARFLNEFKPKIFIFENVPGIKTAKDGEIFKNLKKYFRRIGYELDGKVLNASDFGVLQNRKRIIIIGWRKELNFSYPELDKIKFNATVCDILTDLKPLKPGGVVNNGTYLKKSTEYLAKFEIRNGLDFYTQHITRPHNENDLEIYRLVIDKWNKEKVRLKYTDLPKKNRTQKNLKSFLDRFKVINKKSNSHTLVAHIAKDGHYYIHPDIKQLRSISVREAARIQSFPDDYYFEGSRTSIFKQIGNAVPPLMSERIAKKIAKLL
ncbi:MAG: DNA cytosine methyltransferase [Chlorobi bacterium]|nr:DNA cytosine methyltransferase [Chlorobiota bacterium]MCI0716652.1 DNA cytosine methyltransferase [Chlorobiota bacterium]